MSWQFTRVVLKWTSLKGKQPYYANLEWRYLCIKRGFKANVLIRSDRQINCNEIPDIRHMAVRGQRSKGKAQAAHLNTLNTYTLHGVDITRLAVAMGQGCTRLTNTGLNK